MSIHENGSPSGGQEDTSGVRERYEGTKAIKDAVFARHKGFMRQVLQDFISEPGFETGVYTQFPGLNEDGFTKLLDIENKFYNTGPVPGQLIRIEKRFEK